MVETAWLSLIGYLESGRSVKTVAELYHVSTTAVSNSYRRTSYKQAESVKDRPRSRSSRGSSTDLTTPVEDRLERGMVHQWRSLTSWCAIRAWRGIRTPSSGTIRPIRHVLVTPLLSVFEGAQHRAIPTQPRPYGTNSWTFKCVRFQWDKIRKAVKGAPGLVTPFKAWVGTLPRNDDFHSREYTDLYPACVVHALH